MTVIREYQEVDFIDQIEGKPYSNRKRTVTTDGEGLCQLTANPLVVVVKINLEKNYLR